MGDGDQGGVVDGQRDSSNGLDAGHETAEELILRYVEDAGGEDVAIVEDLNHAHTVCERRDVQQVQQRSLGSTDTSTGGDDLHIGDNFNGTTSNLRGDTEGLEEGGLAGFHTSVTGRNGDIEGSEGTSTSGGGDLVSGDKVADLLEVGGGEDEADVAPDVGKQLLELGVLGEDRTKRTADHGVLAHHDDSLATESDTDLVHLVGTDIVDIDDEDGGWIGFSNASPYLHSDTHDASQ